MKKDDNIKIDEAKLKLYRMSLAASLPKGKLDVNAVRKIKKAIARNLTKSSASRIASK